MLAAVTALGAVVRFYRLSYPHRYVFDETYYARDACLYLARGMAFCHAPGPTEQTSVHPELGKWIIAAGEWLWGYNPFGWRVMAAVFGTALIVVVYVLGRKLFGRWGGAISGLLAATDFVLIAQSRRGMLDIFLTFFVAVGFLFVVFDHERILRLRAPGGGRLRLGWRLGMGLAFGAAIAVKWSGVLALAGAALLLVAWTLGTSRHLRRNGSNAGTPGVVAELVASACAIAIPAAAVYLAAYAAWFKAHHFSLTAFGRLQRDMLLFHLDLRVPNPFQTRAWTWPFLIRPMAYWHLAGNEQAHRVILMPNPLVWWAAIPAGVWFLYRALRRRGGGEPIVMVGWLAQYLPWLAVARPLFFFYMTPVAPFMDLALAGSLVHLGSGSMFRRRLVIVYLIGTVVVGAYLYPGLIGALHPRL